MLEYIYLTFESISNLKLDFVCELTFQKRKGYKLQNFPFFDMVRKEVLHSLIDSKKIAILDVLLNAHEEMVLKEIAEKSKVPMASTFRILQELVGQGLLHKRKWKTSTIYSCIQNEKTDVLKELFSNEYDGVSEFVQLIVEGAGVQSIISHGAPRKGKANLLVIGESLDGVQLEEASQKVREKGFDLTYLPLTKKQYDQMSKMGLYQGEKKVVM